jgi:hypothetical protein
MARAKKKLQMLLLVVQKFISLCANGAFFLTPPACMHTQKTSLAIFPSFHSAQSKPQHRLYIHSPKCCTRTNGMPENNAEGKGKEWEFWVGGARMPRFFAWASPAFDARWSHPFFVRALSLNWRLPMLKSLLSQCMISRGSPCIWASRRGKERDLWS